MLEIAVIAAGCIVGAIIGLSGVGGGSLMTPLLILGFGVKPIIAVGTDLLFAAITKFSGSVQFARARLVNWPIVLHLSLGSIPAALLTIYALQYRGIDNDSSQSLITTTLGFALLLTAAAALHKAWSGQDQEAANQFSPNGHPSDTAHTDALENGPARGFSALTVLLGAVIGTMVALTSVGAGAIGVSALLLLYPRLPLPRIVAADVAYAAALTFVAGLGHASIGTVDWRMLGLLLLGSIPGVWLGSQFVNRVPEKLTRTLLAAVLICAAFTLIL